MRCARLGAGATPRAASVMATDVRAARRPAWHCKVEVGGLLEMPACFNFYTSASADTSRVLLQLPGLDSRHNDVLRASSPESLAAASLCAIK